MGIPFSMDTVMVGAPLPMGQGARGVSPHARCCGGPPCAMVLTGSPIWQGFVGCPPHMPILMGSSFPKCRQGWGTHPHSPGCAGGPTTVSPSPDTPNHTKPQQRPSEPSSISSHPHPMTKRLIRASPAAGFPTTILLLWQGELNLIIYSFVLWRRSNAWEHSVKVREFPKAC